MMRIGAGVAAASLIIVFALVFLAPTGAFASSCILASYYGAESGNRTANGEAFDGQSMTAASRSLPFGARLRVSYRGRSVVVRVNDVGPAEWTHRDLDLSKEAARRLGMLKAGVACVTVERIQ